MKSKVRKAGRRLPTLVCAWCTRVIRRGASKVSHGICRSCTHRWFGKLRPVTPRMPRRVPA